MDNRFGREDIRRRLPQRGFGQERDWDRQSAESRGGQWRESGDDDDERYGQEQGYDAAHEPRRQHFEEQGRRFMQETGDMRRYHSDRQSGYRGGAGDEDPRWQYGDRGEYGGTSERGQYGSGQYGGEREQFSGGRYGGERGQYGAEHGQGSWAGASERRFGRHAERYGSQGGSFGGESGRSERSGWSGSDVNDRGGFGGYAGSGGPESGRRQSGGFGQHTGRGPLGYRRNDERIREDVCDELTDDSHLDASSIQVKVENGEVTLTGTVATRDEKRRAEDLAEGARGVSDVRNELRVQSSTQSGTRDKDNQQKPGTTQRNI